MERQKIALYTASLRMGGVERFVINLSSELVRRGYPVHIVLARAEGPLLEQVAPEARIVDLKARQVSTSLPGLVRYLRAEAPTAMLTLQTHCNITGLIARNFARRPVRVVVSEHNSISPRVHGKSGKEAFLLRSARWFYPHAEGIVAVSRGLAGELAAALRMEPARIAAIYNPIVDANLAAQAQLALDHPWFAPGQPPVVLSVGRLVPQKDHATLLRAFARLRQNRTARLVILGEGPERGTLHTLATRLGIESDVSLPGTDAHPYRFMRRCGVFVLSSAWEGFGNVLIEAMACGAPAISTNCPSGPAEILENGKYGPLVPVGDDKALAAAIGATLDHPLPAPTLQSRAADFSVVKSADAYLRLLLSESP